MKREDIEAFKQRITPYLERHGDKQELEAVCRMAAAFADTVERNSVLLSEPDRHKWSQ